MKREMTPMSSQTSFTDLTAVVTGSEIISEPGSTPNNIAFALDRSTFRILNSDGSGNE